jgi:hypothetical protein
MKISSSDPDVVTIGPADTAPPNGSITQVELPAAVHVADFMPAENHGRCDVGHSGNMSILRF